jgi:hypothetical protein
MISAKQIQEERNVRTEIWMPLTSIGHCRVIMNCIVWSFVSARTGLPSSLKREVGAATGRLETLRFVSNSSLTTGSRLDIRSHCCCFLKMQNINRTYDS